MNKAFILLLFTLLSIAATARTDKSLADIIRRGNIIATTYDQTEEAGCYLGNGRMGAVFAGLGLNLSHEQQKTLDTGQSQFSHLLHWGRFRFNSAIEKHETTADYLLPLFKMYWEKQPENLSDYRQEHDLYDGLLTTQFASGGQHVKLTNWIDMQNKDLAGIHIELSEGVMPIKVSSFAEFIAYWFVFRDKVHQDVTVSREADNYVLTIKCREAIMNAESKVYFYTNAPVEICPDGLRILASKGKNDVFVSYGKPVTAADRKHSLSRTRNLWHKKWQQTGWMSFPDDNAQKLYMRSMAYMLSSHDDFQTRLIQPTNGLTGNVFPFHFIQDLGYIAPALQMTGHTDIVKNWIEKFADEIPAYQRYARQLWPDTEGIYPPWELPFGSVEGYHSPNVPVAYCYEPHNPAYLARMASEVAEILNDRAWAERYAYPLIREVCKFYLSACKKGDDNLWHLSWYPSIGQDEAGGRNKSDYLCSLYSAQYTFLTAIGIGLDTDGRMAAILNDGLAFPSLASSRGTLHTCHGADDFGRQKHPVQLDGVAYFPRIQAPWTPEKKAYELRHDITQDARRPFFTGWTLSEFLLAGSNLGNVEGWQYDWSLLDKSGNTDSRWIQVYETCRKSDSSFYITTHGMLMQSLIRNYVNDYWNRLDIAACPVFPGKVSFGNIHTRLGVSVSGTTYNGHSVITLHALRDCTFTLANQEITMKKGEKRTFNL